jgi:hypothetical protein
MAVRLSSKSFIPGIFGGGYRIGPGLRGLSPGILFVAGVFTFPFFFAYDGRV